MSHRQRRHDAIRVRFPWFLSRWLAKLPADGFTGTSRELRAAMTATSRPFDRIPATNALVRALTEHVGTVAAAGCRVRQRRTARARLVVVERVSADSDGPKRVA